MSSRTILALIAVTAIAAAGCGSTGTDRAGRTVESAENLRTEFEAMDVLVDQTVEALDLIVNAKEGELKPAYDRYVKDLAALEDRAKQVVSRANDLRTNFEDYLAGWEAQMEGVQNPEIRATADERREKAKARFAEARDEFDRIKADFEDFAQDLREIRGVLENDLNPSGVEALGKVIAQAKADAGPVKDDIEEITNSLTEIAKAFSAGKAAE
jgi:chromosome segregation ATPase